MTPAERELLLAVAHTVILGNPSIKGLIDAAAPPPAPARSKPKPAKSKRKRK